MTWISSSSSGSAEAGKRLEELDAVFSALAHRSRRQILLVVRFRGGSMTAGAIARRFHCAWPTVSRHLRVLELSGLLAHEKQGRTRVYRVNEDKLDVVRHWLRWFEGDQGNGGRKSEPNPKS